MVNYYDLNYQIGVLLHKMESEEDFEHYRKLLKALGLSNVLMGKVHEGYCHTDTGDDDTEIEQTFIRKMDKLNLVHSRVKQVDDKSIYDFVGKRVRLESIIPRNPVVNSWDGVLKKVSFIPETGDFALDLLWGPYAKYRKPVFGGWRHYLSDVRITLLDDEA